MATRSRPHHHPAHAMTGPPPTQHDDEVYEEVAQQINPYYASMNFAIPAPDMPAAHSQFHAAQWQCQPNSTMWMEALQPWPTTGVANTAGPVYADWQADASPPWDFQGHHSFATLQNAQSFQAQSPSPTRVDNAFVPPPQQFQQQQQHQQRYPGSNAWTPGWVDEIPPARAVPEVMPSVEAMPDVTRHEPAPVHAPAPIHAAIPAPDHAASPRLHQAPTPTDGLPKYVAPVDGVPPLPVSVRVEKRRRAPTPTIEFEEYATPFLDTVPVTQSAIGPPPPPPPDSPAAMRPATLPRGSPAKAAQGSQTVFKTQSANSKRGHYASDVWERHKPTIQKLYIEEGKPLREVIRTMETEHKFPATQRMYKARFKQWGFVKNNTEKVVSQILKTKFQRDAAGKLSQFTRNGKDVNLQNYLQRKGMTEYDLVDLSTGAGAGADTPSSSLAHVRCRTPPPPDPPGPGRDLRLPDRLRFQDSLVASFKRAFLLWRQEEQESAFGLQAAALTWRVTDFPHLSSLIESARLIRSGDAQRGVAALNRAFWAMNSGSGYFASMDATSSFYFFFHRQSRCWQDDSRIALAVWKFLAAYASARHTHHHNSHHGHPNHPLFHAFKLMYEVVQKEGVAGLRGLLQESSGTVADELERSFGRDHWLKDLIWHRCFPEKSKLRHLQLIRDLRDHGPTRKIVRRLY
ncbi:hypothetical protein KVR01_009371 [Diaporthe batatas]|uniref:uncharacterized protein n=1 Tax=Diaporthe batatas TaxID=748121 RepID=UPI001D037BEC|nr:uncharacterized protein KVR01_009371 [Diaporthe batatas]KAG8161107.1 hypothetical protein KVR01_009371 [Diaporthe batatas]